MPSVFQLLLPVLWHLMMLCVPVRWPRVVFKSMCCGPCFCLSSLWCVFVLGLHRILHVDNLWLCCAGLIWGNQHCHTSHCLPYLWEELHHLKLDWQNLDKETKNHLLWCRFLWKLLFLKDREPVSFAASLLGVWMIVRMSCSHTKPPVFGVCSKLPRAIQMSWIACVPLSVRPASSVLGCRSEHWPTTAPLLPFTWVFFC